MENLIGKKIMVVNLNGWNCLDRMICYLNQSGIVKDDWSTRSWHDDNHCLSIYWDDSDFDVYDKQMGRMCFSKENVILYPSPSEIYGEFIPAEG